MKNLAAHLLRSALLACLLVLALGLLLGLLLCLHTDSQAQSRGPGVPLPGPRLDGTIQFPSGTGASPGAAIFPQNSGYVYIPSADDLTVVSGTQVITSFVGMQPRSAQVNPVNGYLYAFTHSPNGLQELAVISGTETVARIPLDARYQLSAEWAMVTNPSNGYVYLAPGMAATEVLVVAGGQIIGTIPVPLFPHRLVVDPGSGRVYVSLSGSGRVAAIEGTQVIGEVALPAEPYQMVPHPRTGYVYASTIAIGGGALTTTVSVISRTNVVNSIQVNDFPAVMLPDAANDLLYTGGASVTVISGAEKLGTLSVGGPFVTAAADPRTGYAYFGIYSGGQVTVVNGTQVVGTVTTGVWGPRVMAADPVNGRIYVGGSGAGWKGSALSIISGTQAVATLSLDGLPDDLAIDPRSADVYVTSRASHDVTVVRNEALLGTIRQAAYPLAVEYNPANGYIYVGDARSNSMNRVWVVGGKRVLAELPIPGGGGVPARAGAAGLLAVNRADGRVYVPGGGDRSIHIIRGLGYSGVITGLSGSAYYVALDPTGRYLYAAENPDQYALAVIEGDRVIAELPGMPQFSRVKTNPVTGLAYVFGESEIVHVVQGAAEIGVMRMKSKVADVAFDTLTGDVYIGDADGLALARGATLVGYLPVALEYPFDKFGPLAYDPVHRYLYASAGGFGRTLVISGTRQVGNVNGGEIGPFELYPDLATGRVYMLGRGMFTTFSGTEVANSFWLPRDAYNTYMDYQARGMAIDTADGTIYESDFHLHQLSLLADRPDFNLAPVGQPWRVRPGATITHTIELVSQLGFTGPVSLTLAGPRCGLSWQIEPNPAPVPGVVKVTLSAAPYAPFGPMQLFIGGSSQGISHEGWYRLLAPKQEIWLPVIAGPTVRGIEPAQTVWPTRTPWPTPSPRPTSGPTATPCPPQAQCVAGQG